MPIAIASLHLLLAGVCERAKDFMKARSHSSPPLPRMGGGGPRKPRAIYLRTRPPRIIHRPQYLRLALSWSLAVELTRAPRSSTFSDQQAFFARGWSTRNVSQEKQSVCFFSPNALYAPARGGAWRRWLESDTMGITAEARMPWYFLFAR